MPKVDLDRTIHASGKVFFKGPAVVSEADKALIDAELERLKEQESEQSEEAEPAKKTKTKTEK
jgi:hypothetical protein